MKEIFEIAGAILFSTAASGSIIYLLANLIGKSWANIFVEKNKAKLNKDLECYKNELKKEYTKYNLNSEKATYISKAQYDNEFKIYMEIWDKMSICIRESINLYPMGIENVPIDEKEKEEYQIKKYQRYAEAFNEYSTFINKYAPFYKKDFYEKFSEVRKSCAYLGNKYEDCKFGVKNNLSLKGAKEEILRNEYNKELFEKQKYLSGISEKFSSEIREYLLSLKII